MSRKDYKAFAELISRTDMSKKTRATIVSLCCVAFGRDNPNFSSLKFQEASKEDKRLN